MSMPSTATYIVANWKMHKTIGQALEFIDAIIPLVSSSLHNVLIAPPFTALHACARRCQETNIVLGAQNCSSYSEGAFTGEISALMLKEAGASFVILGHSERRHLFHESSSLVNAKVQKALACGLKVIVCIGETGEDYNAGRTQQVLESQLKDSLKDISKTDGNSLMIAYEPVWSIGTGLVAHPQTIEEVYGFCHEKLRELGLLGESKSKVPLLYGGSVNADNAEGLLKTTLVDGLLVGSASLSSDSFGKIAATGTSKSVALL